MKMKILVLLFLLILQNIFSNNFSEYNLILIKKIQVGSELGQIGYGGRTTGWVSCPKSFGISNDNNIYVPDLTNRRVNIYDLKMNYLKTIIEQSSDYCSFAEGLKFENGNIVCFSSEYGIIKTDKNGKQLYFLEKKDIPSNYISTDSFFIINNYMFFYDDNSYVRCINEEGNVLGNKSAITILEEINKKLARTDIKKENDTITEINKERKKIIIGDKFYTNQHYKLKNYYKAINKNSKDKYNINYKEIAVGRLIDYDKDHNSYWYFSYMYSKENKKNGIVIYSKTGDVIDIFHTSDLPFPENNIIGRTAISPGGDIFFMKGDGEFYYFYKIERKW